MESFLEKVDLFLNNNFNYFLGISKGVCAFLKILPFGSIAFLVGAPKYIPLKFNQIFSAITWWQLILLLIIISLLLLKQNNIYEKYFYKNSNT